MRAQLLEDQRAVIELGEILDFNSVQEFRRCYQSLDYTALRSLSIDFSHTRYIDSSGLGVMLNLLTHLKPFGVAIKLTHPNDPIYKILTITHFDKLFVIERP